MFCLYASICTRLICPVSVKAKRGCEIPWKWSYRQIASYQERMEPGSSARVVSVLNC